jgi:hypothetical protein
MLITGSKNRRKTMMIRKLWPSAFATAMLLMSSSANAVYNANMSGIVVTLSTYTDGDYIYLQLNNQPSAHPSCNPAYFVITADTPADRRKSALALLMAAKFSGEPINLGYDNVGNCADGYIRVHRVG